ncbi:23S rRNA (guanine(745)-N(1))-methyltransferase [Microbulbifer aggregans]|uniref:23S rRNA (guanine(745)-N(1))-methyltransferase n=1 Tax=Microbulbifer aggregans TaxID=1769779 RepID=UPI001CFD6932|nr:23S rRNA (guanine(745)-N(1))-methyltransferase [Microbulbifer aggregans]
MIWHCPNCKQTLEPQQNTWRCASGHTFDRAREGYVNLLPVQKKRSREPGDSGEMLQARRRFLDGGHYRPLADAICAMLAAGDSVRQERRLLDIGCGEGYYSRALAAAGWPEEQIAGVDIAKAGVRLAAKRQARAQFAVASSFEIPLADNTVHSILRVFAPGPASELQRILEPGGVLLDVSPGPEHLWSLKRALYREPRQHQPPAPLEGFETVAEMRCAFTLQIKGREVISDFLAMTPFAWKGDGEARAELEQREELQLEADFLLRKLTGK